MLASGALLVGDYSRLASILKLLAMDKEAATELLLDGARYGDEDDVAHALDEGADVDAPGPTGSTGD